MVLTSFLSSVYSFMWCSLMDVAFFMFVDIVVKTTIKDATDEREKRTIWFYESLVLTVISLFVYLFDHVPYALLTLTAVTLVVTQCLSQISVYRWWHTLQTRWDEYQQHQESVRRDRRIHASAQLQSAYQNNVLGKTQSFMDRIMEKFGAFQALFSRQGHQTTARAPMKNPAQAKSGYSDTPQVTVRWRSTSGQKFTPEVRHPRSQATTSMPNVSAGVSGNSSHIQSRTPSTSSVLQPSLARKPLRGYEERKLSLKSRMMSALGINPYVSVPPGLKNDGQNLCFMNCVLQCLARTPFLLDNLSKQAYKEASCSIAESAFLSALAELLRYCNTPPGSSDIAALDPAALQQAASSLPGSPVAAAGHRQIQQDSSEFLMWLLTRVQSILNKNRKGKEDSRMNIDNPERFNSATLSMLKFLYGSLDAGRIEELKYACRREIAMANGMDNESYAEAIQRLSDLEWLTFKQKNVSIVDDLFTGQLVEAFHCLNDNHISVNMQPFLVLSVPIVAPREVSGIVYLEDCFTKFCNIEHLIGPDGVQCSMCDQGTRSPNICPPSTVPYTPSPPTGRIPNYKPHPSHRKILLRDSAVGEMSVMSPIAKSRLPANDSGFLDNHFRTSTPILQRSNGGISPMSLPPRIRLRDAQRRCLLRQLPECLVIQVMRFAMNVHMGDIRKIRAPISVPIKNLNLSHLIYDTVTNRQDLTVAQNFRYDLYALCSHVGGESTNYGHYIAYCRNEDGCWYKFDDEFVIDVNMDYELTTKELRENSYLLFYRRQSSDASVNTK